MLRTTKLTYVGLCGIIVKHVFVSFCTLRMTLHIFILFFCDQMFLFEQEYKLQPKDMTH